MKTKQKISAFIALVTALAVICCAVPYGALASSLETVAPERVTLTPGGSPFGIKFHTKGAVVVDVTDIETYTGVAAPARDAGIKAGDVVTAVDSREITGTDELSTAISECGGGKVVLTVNRSGKSRSFDVYPVKSSLDGTYKSGLWVRDSTAGIGTVTYVNAETGGFAGLGHGICDPETGECLPLLRGLVSNVTITGVVKGTENRPGELKGEFSAYRAGTLDKNTECGVFGRFDSTATPRFAAEPMEICFRDELKAGKAHILSTISGDVPALYEVNIVKVYANSGKTKNFLIEVTDRNLLSVTGGIVQGMSGSPVIQNGRLAGAVTHVMINDPTKGYGIFIENMLAESVD